MDLLTDVLRYADVRRRVLDTNELTPGTSLPFPCDKSMGFHIALCGTLLIHSAGTTTPIRLGRGDVALMARGCHHQLSADGVDSGVEQPQTRVLSAAYQLWHAPVHPFFVGLPDWYVLRYDDQARLAPLPLLVEMINQEVRAPRPGSQSILNGLLDAAFAYLLRALVDEPGPAQPGFGQALRSEPVRRALYLLQQDCAQDWTLETLAASVALSRTALAVKFREAMGDTPLSYLRSRRIQRAIHLLGETDHALEAVATQVGYRDAFSFSKVFKRSVGMSPREFRQRDRAAAASPFRFSETVIGSA